MRVKVRWLIDGVMEVEADSHEQAEEHVSALLSSLIDQVPQLRSHFGAQAIQGQAVTDEDEQPAHTPDTSH